MAFFTLPATPSTGPAALQPLLIPSSAIRFPNGLCLRITQHAISVCVGIRETLENHGPSGRSPFRMQRFELLLGKLTITVCVSLRMAGAETGTRGTYGSWTNLWPTLSTPP